MNLYSKTLSPPIQRVYMSQVSTKYMDSELKSTLRKKFSNLLDSEKAEDFEISQEVEDNIEILVEGSRSNAEHWGDDRYSVDFLFGLRKSDELQWNEVEDTIEEYQKRSSEILTQSIGYNGPVVFRADDDKDVLQWERRILLEYENSEE